MKRAARLISPLTHAEVFEAEAADKKVSRAIRNGGWQKFAVTSRAVQGFGPHSVTCNDVATCPEEFAISVAARVYRPDAFVLTWVDDFLAAASKTD